MWEAEPKKTWVGQPVVVMFIGEGKEPSYHLVHNWAVNTFNVCVQMCTNMGMDEFYFKTI